MKRLAELIQLEADKLPPTNEEPGEANERKSEPGDHPADAPEASSDPKPASDVIGEP